MIAIFEMRATDDLYIITDTAILIDDRILYHAPASDPKQWHTSLAVVLDLVESFEEVVTHQVYIGQYRFMTNTRTNTDHRMIDVRSVDYGPFGYYGLV